MTLIEENHHFELGTKIVELRLSLAPQNEQNELKAFGSHRNQKDDIPCDFPLS